MTFDRAEAPFGNDLRRSALDGFGEGLLLLDRDFTVLDCNTAAERLEARPRAALIGHVHAEASDPAATLGDLCRRALADGVSLAGELRRDDDARRIVVRVHVLDGERLAIFLRDVTDLRRAETRIAETEARARTDAERLRLAHAAGAIIGTWFWDVVAGRFIIDQQFADTFGIDESVDREHLRFDQVVANVHPEDRAALAQAIDRTIANGGAYAHQYRVRGIDGRYRWIEANGRVDRTPDGSTISFPGVILDAGERRALMAERDRAAGLLATFVEAVPGVVYAKDRQGRMLVANRGTTELVGKPMAEIIGRTDREFLEDKVQAAAVMATDEQIMASGEAVQIEEEVNFSDGRPAIWLSHKAPFRDAAGNVIGLVGSSIDVSGRRAAEVALRETEERYRLAAGATNDAIWDWRLADGHVIWNEALQTSYGHPLAATDAQWWLDHIHADDRVRVDHEIHAVIEGTGTMWSSAYRFRRADGSYADVFDRGFVLRDHSGAAVRMIGAMQDLSARRVAETALAESETRARLAAEAAAIGTWELDLVTGVLRWDARTKALFGLSPEADVSYDDAFIRGIHPADRDRADAAVAAAVSPGGSGHYAIEYRTIGLEDGVERWVAARGRSILDEAGQPIRFVGTVIDVTDIKNTEARLRELNETLEQRVAEEVAERAKAEEALRQSQKMEAVGQLTGGIAHDFNNLLTVVVGNIDMGLRALEAAGGDPRVRRALDNAQKGAERAATLTQRLLAFARRQPLAPKALDADRLVAGMSDLIGRALGEQTRLEIITSPGLWRVEVDPNQLESAILNLAVNARDAMPDGGTVTIETANARLDEAYTASHAEVPPGNYVMIAVTDTGTGMSRETITRVFEPFFTTKEVGKGTGLGLSMVYGFTKQSGGHVKLYSEEGRGTTVKIYLPRLMHDTGTDEEEAHIISGLEVSRRQETILVTEDDDDVRAYTVDCLRELGYRVLEAHDGPSALRLMARQDGAIDLLFTDVVMPEMSGKQLADAARARQPTLRVLYTSGYTRNAIVHGGRLDEGVEMIAKPFTSAALARKVRDMLDSGRTRRVLLVEPDATARALAVRLLADGGFATDDAANAAEALGRVRAAQGRYDVILIATHLSDKPGTDLARELRALHADLPLLLLAKDAPDDLASRLAADRRTAILAEPFDAADLATALSDLGMKLRGA